MSLDSRDGGAYPSRGMGGPSNEELERQVARLGSDLRSVKRELEELKVRLHLKPDPDPVFGAPPPAAAAKAEELVEKPKPAPAPAPAPAPKEEAKQPWDFSEVLKSTKPELPGWDSYKSAAEKAPAPKAEAPLPAELAAKASGPLASAPKVSSAPPPVRPAPPTPFGFDEKYIGQNVLQYVGALILGLGVVFFLVWTATHTGPLTRSLMAAGAGAALVWLGVVAMRNPPYDRVAHALVGGGWSILYITAYAVSHLEPVRIVTSPVLGLGLILAAAGGMVGHCVSFGSRPLRLYAVALAHALLFFCRGDIGSFDPFVILLAASALVAVGTGEADVLFPSLAGFYLNYAPVYLQTINLPLSERSMQAFLRPAAWLAAGYLILALLPALPRAREKLAGKDQLGLFDAALCWNALAFALAIGSMARIYFGHASMQRALMVAPLFLVPGFLQLWALGKKSGAASISGVLPMLLVGCAAFEMPDPMWKLFSWVLISSAWTLMGLASGQPVWRAAGLVMSVLTFVFYAEVARQGVEQRKAAAMALFVYSAMAYCFSRYYRLWLDDAEAWEEPISGYWLWSGSFALVLGLWGCLDAAPFLCAMVALAILGEHVSKALGRRALWEQAALLELFLGVYSFFVDYSAQAVVLRPAVSALVVLGYAYIIFAEPQEGEPEGQGLFARFEQRRILSWLLFFVSAFAVYREVDGRIRLPIWAFSALGLFWLARNTKKEDFRAMSILLMIGTGVEAMLSYLFAPAASLGTLSGANVALYWASVGSLVGGVSAARDTSEGRVFDGGVAKFCGLLALVLGAAYMAKEFDSHKLTLAWTLLGFLFLGGGMAQGWGEVRRPGLALLGLCVAKALVVDTVNLPLPFRVASFIALGLVLLFASSLYQKLETAE